MKIQGIFKLITQIISLIGLKIGLVVGLIGLELMPRGCMLNATSALSILLILTFDDSNLDGFDISESARFKKDSGGL